MYLDNTEMDSSTITSLNKDIEYKLYNYIKHHKIIDHTLQRYKKY